MHWYLTIAPQECQKTKADSRPFIEYLTTLTELKQEKPMHFGPAPGQPWIFVDLLTAKGERWASDGSFTPTFNRVEMVCAEQEPPEWYENLAIRMAKFLDWIVTEEHENRQVWPTE